MKEITDINILKSMYNDLEGQLYEFAALVSQMRSAENDYYKLRYSQDTEKRAEAQETMRLLQKCVDSELYTLLNDE